MEKKVRDLSGQRKETEWPGESLSCHPKCQERHLPSALITAGASFLVHSRSLLLLELSQVTDGVTGIYPCSPSHLPHILT